jgi:hypothetical protein
MNFIRRPASNLNALLVRGFLFKILPPNFCLGSNYGNFAGFKTMMMVSDTAAALS